RPNQFCYPPPQPPPTSTLFPYTTLFRSLAAAAWQSGPAIQSPKNANGDETFSSWNGLSKHRPGAQLPKRERAHKQRDARQNDGRSEEHTSELQSRFDLVCRLLLDNNTEL